MSRLYTYIFEDGEKVFAGVEELSDEAIKEFEFEHGRLKKKDWKRLFTYRFEDGHEIEALCLEPDDIADLELQHGDCIFNGWDEFMGIGKPSRMAITGGANSRGDAFRTGWHPGLGMEIKSQSHYNKVLKERGLREVGNEKQSSKSSAKKSYVDDDIIKMAVDAGASISGNEAEALKKGDGL